MNRHILVATPLYPPDIGGPATYTKFLEDELPARGISVRVVAFGGSRHLPKGISHVHYFFRILKNIRQCDFVLAQDPVSVGFPLMLAAKLFGKKFFIRMPGDYAWEQSVQRFGVTDTIDDFQNIRYGFRVELLRTFQVFVSKRADAIITPSDYFKQLVQKWGVQKERVVTIYNGIDFNEMPLPVKKPTGKTMITAGRLVPWKGIRALFSVLEKLPDWNLHIIGEGPMQKELEEHALATGVRERVVFMGSLPRNEVLGWCRDADAFVLNTHFESFSFQIVEAMMCNASIITTAIGSIPELITDGEEGVLLSPDDVAGMVTALQSITEEREIWRIRKRKAGEKAKHFTIQNTLDGLESLIDQYTVR